MFLRRSPSTEELKGAALRRMSRIYSEGRLPSTQRKLFLERIGNHYDNASYLHQVLHDLGEFEESRPPILIRAVELAASYNEDDETQPSKMKKTIMVTPKQVQPEVMSRRSPWDKCYRAVRQRLRDEFGEFAFAAHETHIKSLIKAVAGGSSASSPASSKKDDTSSPEATTPEVIPVTVVSKKKQVVSTNKKVVSNQISSQDLRRVAQEQRRMALDKSMKLTASSDNISFVGWWGKKKPRSDKFQDRIFVIQQGMLAYFESTARAIELKPQKKPLRLNSLLDVQSPSTNKATLSEAHRRRVSGLKKGRRGSDPSDDVMTCDLVFSLSNGLKKFHLVGPPPSHPSLERRKAREMVDVLRAIAFANDAANHSKLSEDTTKKDVLMKRRASLLKRASSVVSKMAQEDSARKRFTAEENLGVLSVLTRTRDPKPVDVDEDWERGTHWTDDLDFGEDEEEELAKEEKYEEEMKDEERFVACDFAIRGYKLGCTPIESESSDIPKRVMDLRYCEFRGERDAEGRLVRSYCASASHIRTLKTLQHY